MVEGKGGFIASDLSGYARTHSVEETRSAITNPNPSGDRQARTVTAIIRGGENMSAEFAMKIISLSSCRRWTARFTCCRNQVSRRWNTTHKR